MSTLTAGHVGASTDALGIATISFYHPAHNSLPGQLLRQLADTITKTGQANTTKVIILKSEGERTFCAGASFDELVAIEDEAQGQQFFSGFAQVINACRTCPKVIIGRVQGKAIGGGVGAFAEKLAGYNPEALAALKQVIWAGTEQWDSLLSERAAISGRLVLSDFTRQSIAQFKAAAGAKA
uniref:Cytochrome c domain-containing protein n=1 Tax=Tanacetum cinerariifolium TaxID=118510 RepID=A0A699QZ40_TANCI|nr:hypothetical protein [Tanacetum cinerariifolium]